MLFKYLDHLRTKPKETRQRVAFLTALALTLVIGGIWSLTLPARFAGTGELAAAEGTRPFARFFGGLKEQFGNIRNQAETIAATVGSTTVAATATDMINLEALLESTSTPPTPKPDVVLIGTTSASTTVNE